MQASIPQFDRVYSYCEIQIKLDEDWKDTVVLQRLMADGTIADFSFAAVARLDLFIRPVFDHSTLIYKLSSNPDDGGGISYQVDVPGQIQIYLGRASLIAAIPTGRWDHFLVATDNSGFTEEFWRGSLLVHPGKISA